MKNFLPLILIIFIYKGCAPSPSRLATSDPALLVTQADSLLAARPDDVDLRSSIIKARLNLAEANNDMNQYEAVLKMDPRNGTANYHIHMAKGKVHYKKGHKNGQWDAIQSFAKAVAAIDSLGAPHYWLGQAYEKKDEMDFELPLEAYDKALNLYLPQDIHTLIIANREALVTVSYTHLTLPTKRIV